MNLPNQAKPVSRNRFKKRNLASVLPSSEEMDTNDSADDGGDETQDGYEGNDQQDTDGGDGGDTGYQGEGE